MIYLKTASRHRLFSKHEKIDHLFRHKYVRFAIKTSYQPVYSISPLSFTSRFWKKLKAVKTRKMLFSYLTIIIACGRIFDKEFSSNRMCYLFSIGAVFGDDIRDHTPAERMRLLVKELNISSISFHFKK